MNTSRWSFLTALLLSCCVTMTAWGDDLEIYIGANNVAEEFPPNVLFIMDTSGSMTNKDGGSETRILRVQNALNTVLSTVTNINAGLMRFSDYGGPILYPVTNIDQSLSSELITSTSASADDAHEINGSVNLNNNRVTITSGTATVTSGFRFNKLDIPQGATITSARLRFSSGQSDVSNADIAFYGELVTNSQSFTTGNSNISKRPLTSAKTEWSTGASFPVSGNTINTPDITAVVQEVVNQSGWCGGNALSIIAVAKGQSSSSAKRVVSADDGTSGAPQIVVNYDDTTATGCIASEDIYQVASQANNVEERSDGNDSTGSELTFKASDNKYTAVRFGGVQIPNGATILGAKLVFKAYQSSNSSSASMKISAVNKDDMSNFSNHKKYMIRDIAKTSKINMSVPQIWKNQEYRSPELKSIVQTIVNRSGWSAGNAMGFVMSDFSGTRGAYTYKGQPSGAVRLEISYTGNAVPGASLTVRDFLKSQVDQLTANGYTPIVDTLYEATNYFAGNNVRYGLKRGESGVSSNVRRSTRVSHQASYIGSAPVRPSGCTEANLSDSDCIGEYIPSGAKYISPITDLQCQTNNHIVLLSDGAANNNHSAGLIKSMLGISSCQQSGGNACAFELASNISNTSESVVGTKVTLHTIGFAANATVSNFLNQLAQKGKGGFYTADSSEDLVKVFTNIFSYAKDVNTTFVSPGVAVNQQNRLTHRDDLYYALFKPKEGSVWPGNLKKYKLTNGKVLDQNNRIAVNDSTGFFDEESRSFWSLNVDGHDVEKGGAASKQSATRNMFYFSGPGKIMASANRVHEDNDKITTSMLNIIDSASPTDERKVVLQWARGVDVKDEDGDSDYTDLRLAMGDPIHSQPTVIEYSNTETAIYVATNQGFLHSIDAKTGSENFAIIPQELLENLPTFYKDASSFNHVYGLDGDIVPRTFSNKKYLYVGMRRGGRNYYVFDVTSKSSPSLVFAIRGGSSGLEKLGQTWSTPTITKVKIGSVEKNVMIVGGGYDESQDDRKVRSPDSLGNAVYMFDADTGSLLWSASKEGASLNISSMQYSIPGRVSAIDRNSDGYVDHMYVADMGGQMFRFDIYNGETGEDFIKGAKIADFGGDTEADNRRFYYGPDVSEIALGTDLYYAVAIGSGKRASPLDTVIQDRFYMLRDESVFAFNSDGSYTFPEVATESNMYNATAQLLNSDDESVRNAASAAFATKSGWMIDFGTSGEKVLSSPLIIDYKIFFTTYIPAESSTSSCAPPAGNSRAYLVNILNGNAVDYVHKQRSVDLITPGIPPPARIFVTPEPVLCLGTECTPATVKPPYEANGPMDFERLASNIFGQSERVKRSSWRTETEQGN